MISFVWSSKYPFLAGAGGSENYTAGQMRELLRRGISTRLLTIGFGEQDGRDGFPDLPFQALSSKEALSELNDTLVFVTYPLEVPTKRQSYVILHCPPESCGADDPLFNPKALEGKYLLVPSKFSSKMWTRKLGILFNRLPIAYPFAENEFSKVRRAPRSHQPRVLFAGRLTPDKGVYTLMAALQMSSLCNKPFQMTATTAGRHTEEGGIIHTLLKAHPLVDLVPAARTPKEMARLMAVHDVVVIPSTNIFWRENFGIVSVEAQHAGCRVVASESGGLAETDCGGLLMVKPDDPQALANGLAKAMALGPLTTTQRMAASKKFTVQKSVDSLLAALNTKDKKQQLLQSTGQLVHEQLDLARGVISPIQPGRRLQTRKGF